MESHIANVNDLGVYLGVAAAARQNEAMPAEWLSTYTVMMRNIPNKYSQQSLREEIEYEGFEGCFDFLYLPIDPETKANKGYAFINFVDPSYAWTFRNVFEARKMSSFNSGKVVSVVPAALQGFDANYAHYSSTQVNHKDPSVRPLFLREPSQLPDKPRRRRRAGRGSLIDIAARKLNALQTQEKADATIGDTSMPQTWSSVHKPSNKQQIVNVSSDVKPLLRFCPFCGVKVADNYNFCSFCGKSLNFIR